MAARLVTTFVRPAFTLGRVCVRAASNTAVRATTQPLEGLKKSLLAEYQQEKESYEQPSTITQFLKETQWKLQDVEGDSTMKITKELQDKLVTVEWQSVSPYTADPEMMDGEENAENEQAMDSDTTNFTITVSDKTKERGIMFYCCTAMSEGHRYVIGNVRSYTSAAERDCTSAYAGPDFEDLDDSVQESFDEFLASAGINDQLCDFIDHSAVDKEQREYIRWLKNVQEVFTH